jgi:flagellar protein FliL
MTHVDQGAELDYEEEAEGGGGRSKLKLIVVILAGLLLVGGAGGAAWYFLLGGRAYLSPAEPKKVEAPLPYFFELKPFVVSVSSRNGPSRFVQLGLSFQLPGSGAGELITAILPQVQDALRQTVLSFKSEDLQSPDGVEKVRVALMTTVNKTLAKDLGPDRLEKVNPGKPNEGFVQNIYFSQLIVE